MAITRPTITDDTGTGEDGTVYSAAFFSDIFDRIDALMAASNTMGAPLTLDQGAQDTAILKFLSSDSNHGMTALEATDIYGKIQKVTEPRGLKSRVPSGAGSYAVQITGMAAGSRSGKVDRAPASSTSPPRSRAARPPASSPRTAICWCLPRRDHAVNSRRRRRSHQGGNQLDEFFNAR